MPAWEDLDTFLQHEDAGGFAVDATVTFQAGGTRDLRVVFDDPYLNAELGEYDMDTSRPRAWGKEVDMAGIQRGDTLNIGGIDYDILTSPQPEGTGMAMLDLAVSP